MATVRSSVRQLRVKAGLQQQELAARVGISRQSLGLIEAGETVPSTSLALQLAATLGCRVEDLFVLVSRAGGMTASIAPDRLAGRTPLREGERLRLGFVEGRWVAHRFPGDTAAATAADALAAAVRTDGTVISKPLRTEDDLRANLLAAGCDPALGLLASHLATGPAGFRVHWIESSSRAALEALARGEVHIAGIHLRLGDASTLPAIRGQLGETSFVVVTLASWQQGFAAAKPAIKRFRDGAALARKGVRVVAREPGAGARGLLERVLGDSRLTLKDVEVATTVYSHHAVAQTISLGLADVGVTTEAAAAAFDLGFHPLAADRFDMVMRAETAASATGQKLLDTMTGAPFRRDAGALPGYLTQDAGKVVATVAA